MKKYMMYITFAFALVSMFQVVAASAPMTPWCHTFNKEMRIGDSNPDVLALQAALSLSNSGFYSHDITGYFDEYTASAVSGFQEKYSSNILDPSGFSYGTGVANEATLGKLNQLFACPEKNLPPTINMLGGPVSLNAYESGVWSITASDPENGPLTYSIDFGDKRMNPRVENGIESKEYAQTATFSHAYAHSGSYVVTVQVTDDHGMSATSTVSVYVDSKEANMTGSAVISAYSLRCFEGNQMETGICKNTQVDAYVEMYDSNGDMAASQYTDGGVAEFWGLAEGAYTARASASGYGSGKANIYITPGTTQYADIYLEEYILYEGDGVAGQAYGIINEIARIVAAPLGFGID